MQFDFKKILPHIYIILGFIVVAFLFSYPQLDGLMLFQSDYVQWKAMATEGMDWHEKTGENVMWSNSMFGGMPTFTHYVPESNNYIHYIQVVVMETLKKPAAFLFLAMLGFYILALTLGFNRWLGIAGALAYAFSTYNITLIEAGHETKILALAYVPVVIAGLLQLYRGKWWAGIPLLGVSLSLLMSTGHYQIMYYTIIIIVAMVISLFITALKEKQLKTFFIASAIAMVTAAIGIGPSMQLFLVTLEYNKSTMRGGQSELTINHDEGKKGGGLDKDYAFAWSNSWGESFASLVPMLYGGSNRENIGENSESYEVMTEIGVPEQGAAGFVESFPGYWGPQPFTGGPFYFGAIIVFLFVLGMMVIRSPHKWWILAVSILAFLMSIGKHFPAFNYFLFDTLPGLNKFRIPNMILVIPQLLFPLVAIWALNDIITGTITKEEIWKKVRTAGIATGGLCLLLGLGSTMFFDFKSHRDAALKEQLMQSFQNEEATGRVMSAVQADRADMAMKSGIMSAVFIALAVGLLWAFAQDKIKGQYAVIGIAALVTIDLVKIDSRYLNEENYIDPDQFEAQFAPRPVDQQIKQDPDPYYRVLDLSVDPFNNAMQAAHHKCIGGYSPAKMEVYQDLIDVHMRSGFNRQVLNMLNTKYIISPQGPQGQPVAIPNAEACGNAWFVDNIQWEETADNEMLAMRAGNIGEQPDTTKQEFNPKQTAVLRTTYKDDFNGYQVGKDSAAVVQLAEYGLNNISYVSNNSRDGFAVFSDIYYPYGWKAYIDGKETPIYRTNYLLRALKVPAGEHKIEFKFHPEKFYTGDKIAMVSSLLLILAAAGSVFMAVRGGKKPA